MKSARITLGIAVSVVLALLGGAPASAAPATNSPTTWKLLDVGQRLCASPDDPRTLYYFVVLDGTWSAPITAGYTGMPEGTEVYGPLIIQPGAGDGHGVQAWATFRLSGATQGRHVPKLWATDGHVTQSVPVILDIQTRC